MTFLKDFEVIDDIISKKHNHNHTNLIIYFFIWGGRQKVYVSKITFYEL